MDQSRIIAALDVGTTKIVALVAEMDDQDQIYVIGHGEAAAEGMRRGVITNMDKVVTAIKAAIADAQMTSGTEIDRVTLGIAGEHIRSINSHGVVAVGRSDNEINAADVKRAIDAARAVAIPVDREVIHVIPQSFSVDDQPGIKNPVGMSGVRLEVQAHIVTASITTAKNLYRALERCHLGVDHLVLESLAVSQSLLSERELEAGAIVLDIGGELTNVAVFFDGAIQHTAVVGLGGKNVTNDIAIGLRTSVEQAEALKLAHGAAVASSVDADELIAVPSAGDRDDRELSRSVIASVVEPRMEEILSLALRELRKAGATEALTGGLVLTGGGSLLPGTVALAEQILDIPSRLGTITGIESTPEDLNNNRYAAAHGLLIYGFTTEPEASGMHRGVSGWLHRLEDWIQRQF
jgi:cell division protein FtsA